ncbi:40S ribosomal protein S4 [Pteropus alecto]|uniref:40S ribosomal protein S4 n=1 Tax=Pteropus alecto TaxID=9402 RepID=L5K6N0_PTEAL|nr:40S ribosomal protein S4 [Pteropus alecto]
MITNRKRHPGSSDVVHVKDANGNSFAPIQIDLETGKITNFIRSDTGNLCMVTGGGNLGRIAVITNRERHPGSSDVVHVKDVNGNSFAPSSPTFSLLAKSINRGFLFSAARLSASPLQERQETGSQTEPRVK